MIVVLCGFLILADGYDLVMYGTVIPRLLEEPGWNLTSGLAGAVAGMLSIGMLVGALVAGTLADRIGRRKLVVASVIWFSVAMILCAIAPSLTVFIVVRVLGGVGLGALFPVVTALVMEFAPPNRKAIAYSLTLFGYLAGGIVAGVLGFLLIPSLGWRSMFWIGAIPLLLVPVVIVALPESPAWLAARGKLVRAREIAARFGIPLDEAEPHSAIDRPVARRGAIFRDGRAASTLLAWGIQFCSLLLVFGIVNWLPTIMVQLGFDIQSALLFAVVLNVGAAIGAVVGSRIADRRRAAAPVVVTLFVLGAAAIIALSFSASTALMFVLVAIAGAGTLGTQILVNVLIGSIYPTAIRGTGLGYALAFGRLGAVIGPVAGGLIIGAGLPAQYNFYLFAAVGVLGAVFAVPFVVTRARSKASA
jgi:AAHS family benzoate transporter-like MFS transporter